MLRIYRSFNDCRKKKHVRRGVEYLPHETEFTFVSDVHPRILRPSTKTTMLLPSNRSDVLNPITAENHTMGASWNASNATSEFDYYYAYDGKGFSDGTYPNVLATTFAVMFFLGVTGHALLCFVLVKSGTAISVTNIYLMSLCASDLTFIVICVPFTGSVYVLPSWPFGIMMCEYHRSNNCAHLPSHSSCLFPVWARRIECSFSMFPVLWFSSLLSPHNLSYIAAPPQFRSSHISQSTHFNLPCGRCYIFHSLCLCTCLNQLSRTSLVFSLTFAASTIARTSSVLLFSIFLIPNHIIHLNIIISAISSYTLPPCFDYSIIIRLASARS